MTLFDAGVPATPAPLPTGTAQPTEVSPGSRHPKAESPGAGVRAPATWTSKSPGTPIGLRQQVSKPYQPRSEPLEKYEDRVTRMATHLVRSGSHYQMASSRPSLRKLKSSRGCTRKPQTMRRSDYKFSSRSLPSSSSRLAGRFLRRATWQLPQLCSQHGAKTQMLLSY